MILRSEHEPRLFRIIVVSAMLISVFIGSTATLRSGVVPWPSLVYRPLAFGVLGFMAILVGRRGGFVAVAALFGVPGVLYVFGGFNASYLLLRSLRWGAAAFFLWSFLTLVNSLHKQSRIGTVLQ